ncbi:dolichyl-phosphate-mannose--protein mannosyltransferase [Stackebrandtia nassauensis]|uniref:Polyprenol-phosphate-mannose--protein mannosyltransferase n=1 Tax=Stackebrandtia nassauensis (strain DSM 44728 / CIP 108903 / NRRL B-16338 / NBRC 102104 / LLR-40K-21) TaxID=446470 RepID=D3PY22_STANL|nr:phospholipid carrier-dependent glycosyltransferase [Stackebrandtia nassauensis]ADD45351.1 glycosyl transferase family 39 [Stackebrandtia nassauensis DSM 44728]
MSAAAVDAPVRPPADPTDPVPARLRARLSPWRPTNRLQGWLIAGLVTAFGAALRLVGLTHPKGLIFDEVYYAQDAKQLLDHGVEWDVETANGSYVAHPPLGKWCIALGEWLFGYDEFGWRISSAVAGIISILLITLLARRLTGSTVLGAVAGLLVSMDGMHLVLSRTALLDIFLMLFLLAAFYCLVLDRESRRSRWLAALSSGLDPTKKSPPFQFPWWRVAAAVLSGCAMGVKWSALWFIILFLILIFVWEWQLRRLVGTRTPILDALVTEIGWLFTFGIVSILTYLATWTGWFATDNGYFRHWLADSGSSEPPVLGALVNLWHYHTDVLSFHDGLSSPHTYQSWPWQWILDIRPVVFFWSSDVDCGAPECASEVLLLGTPLLWWAFIPALIALVWWGLSNRDWRAWAIFGAAFAGIAPWLLYPDRTMFSFYALPAVPFLVLALTVTLGLIIGPRTATPERRLSGSLIAAGIVILIALCFAYFWPLYTGQIMTNDDWHARIWLEDRWI